MNDAAPIPSLDTLAAFVAQHPRLFVLTGAGCSTDSGIPDYRDTNGAWKHRRPIQFQDFIRQEHTRQRYWARSLIGWRRFARAQPNAAHYALAELEHAGFIHRLVTQNVDGLHQRAGSHSVTDLHGRLDTVECLGCRHAFARADYQHELAARNANFHGLSAIDAPDGDAQLEDVDFRAFRVPPCPRCGGVLKPAVVFFGEGVPRVRVDGAYADLAVADAMLVVGSSLMVYSGYRFCCAAVEQGKPIAVINLGRTRADDALAIKITAPCAEVLASLARRFRAYTRQMH